MKLAQFCNASFVTRVYNRLFTKILDSSIWLEPLATRVVWITLLAAMDEEGFAPFACAANVARRAGVEVSDTEAALTCLESPDPNSSDPDNEGRRIERVAGGYLVLNASKYRGLFNREIQREQTRIRVARHRESKRTVTDCNAPVTVANDPVTQSEAEACSEAKASAILPEEPTTPRKRGGVRKNGSLPLQCSGFEAFWKAFPNKKARARAEESWVNRKCLPHLEKILTTIAAFKTSHEWQKDGGQFIPHPASWLNSRGWEDELLPRGGGAARVRTYEHDNFEEC